MELLVSLWIRISRRIYDDLDFSLSLSLSKSLSLKFSILAALRRCESLLSSIGGLHRERDQYIYTSIHLYIYTLYIYTSIHYTSIFCTCDVIIMSDKERNRLKIFVGNLPFTADNKAVQMHFQECGRIVGVNVSFFTFFFAFRDVDVVSYSLSLFSSFEWYEWMMMKGSPLYEKIYESMFWTLNHEETLIRSLRRNLVFA